MHDILSRLRAPGLNRNTTETKTYIFRLLVQHQPLNPADSALRANDDE